MGKIVPINNWTDFKALAITKKSLQLQYADYETYYEIYALDVGIIWETCILKTDATDFETNYKATANAPIIQKAPSFAEANGFEADSEGFSGTAEKNGTRNVDFPIGSYDRYMHGGELLLNNHVFGDTYSFQIVDKDYVYAGVLYPATYNGVAWNTAQPNGVKLKQFRTNWNVASDRQTQTITNYNFIAKIPALTYLRVIYVSTGLVLDVSLRPNLLLVKKT